MSGTRQGYEWLAGHLRAQIEAGTWAPGQRMPSEKDLMDEHGLARETVRRAMALLRSEGLVDIRHGHGTRVKEPTEREVVRIPRYSHVLTRPATAAERAELGLRDGELVVEVRTGAKVSVYPADRTEFTTA